MKETTLSRISSLFHRRKGMLLCWWLNLVQPFKEARNGPLPHSLGLGHRCAITSKKHSSFSPTPWPSTLMDEYAWHQEAMDPVRVWKLVGLLLVFGVQDMGFVRGGGGSGGSGVAIKRDERRMPTKAVVGTRWRRRRQRTIKTTTHTRARTHLGRTCAPHTVQYSMYVHAHTQSLHRFRAHRPSPTHPNNSLRVAEGSERNKTAASA